MPHIFITERDPLTTAIKYLLPSGNPPCGINHHRYNHIPVLLISEFRDSMRKAKNPTDRDPQKQFYFAYSSRTLSKFLIHNLIYAADICSESLAIQAQMLDRSAGALARPK